MKEPGSVTSLDLIRKIYPRANPAEQSVNLLYDIIRQKLDLKPEQILHADSICCDEVNTLQYPAAASEMIGAFKMGGLSGYPFAGLAALNTAAQHIPEHGAMLISYGPHIGVNHKGVAGELRRTGQCGDSICCGAVISSLQKIKEKLTISDVNPEDNYQINRVQQILLKSENRLMTADNPIIEATAVMYEAIDEKIQDLISKSELGVRHVFIAGMILINGDFDQGAYYQYKRLEHLDTLNNTRVSWLEEFNSKAE
ncbi:hypothetical protein N180_11725 [Pedobacter antarcticus 4BY]|uniref:Limiting CO2-inducible protein B/C beta carbonyic anhydrase domain-containing protein n=2 Tax=Pedobacter antarcticus TaxID=34086 RepID=A0A081PM58_9SPHI|nr:hypothetical protein [Pedobacter antarcticus]KEQ31781.1 hypothetical protein N180_11725 [Pedobacter antarcticus 4BY]SFF34277.1 hypothetical protein SAMN03003324_03395 [Pedobacter antarcticus]